MNTTVGTILGFVALIGAINQIRESRAENCYPGHRGRGHTP